MAPAKRLITDSGIKKIKRRSDLEDGQAQIYTSGSYDEVISQITTDVPSMIVPRQPPPFKNAVFRRRSFDSPATTPVVHKKANFFKYFFKKKKKPLTRSKSLSERNASESTLPTSNKSGIAPRALLIETATENSPLLFKDDSEDQSADLSPLIAFGSASPLGDEDPVFPEKSPSSTWGIFRNQVTSLSNKMESGVKSSLKAMVRKDRKISPKMSSDEFRLRSERARARWAMLREKVLSGYFLLYSIGASNKFNPEQQDRDELIKEALEEIRSGITFSPMQCFAAVGAYLGISLVAYNFFLEPDWTFIDTCYFAITTFTTVGYGDITPSNNLSRLFTCIYAIVGVAILGIALGILGSKLIDAQEEAISEANELNEAGILSAFDSTSPNLSSRRIQEKKQSLSLWSIAFKIIRVSVVLGVLLSYIGFSSQWDIVKTVYYGVITAVTVGYGDEVPFSQDTKLAAIFFIPLSVAVTAEYLGWIANTIIEQRSARFRKQLEDRELSAADLAIMDTDSDGKIDRAEFIEFMLVAMNKIDQSTVEELRRHFKKLDLDGSGVLEKEDLIVAARRRLHGTSSKLSLASYRFELLRLVEGSSTNTKKSDAKRKSWFSPSRWTGHTTRSEF